MGWCNTFDGWFSDLCVVDVQVVIVAEWYNGELKKSCPKAVQGYPLSSPLCFIQRRSITLNNTLVVQSSAVQKFDITVPECSRNKIDLRHWYWTSLKSRIYLLAHTGGCFNAYEIQVHANTNSGGDATRVVDRTPMLFDHFRSLSQNPWYRGNIGMLWYWMLLLLACITVVALCELCLPSVFAYTHHSNANEVRRRKRSVETFTQWIRVCLGHGSVYRSIR